MVATLHFVAAKQVSTTAESASMIAALHAVQACCILHEHGDSDSSVSEALLVTQSLSTSLSSSPSGDRKCDACVGALRHPLWHHLSSQAASLSFVTISFDLVH